MEGRHLDDHSWDKAVDYEYFDQITITEGTAVVTTETFFSGAGARTSPATNFFSGKVANPFLMKGVRVDKNIAVTTTGLTTQQTADLITSMLFSSLLIKRGTDILFMCQTGRFYDSYPLIGEKGTAASLTGLFVKKRIVPLNSDVVILPNDPISATLVSPVLGASNAVITTIALLGKLAK